MRLFCNKAVQLGLKTSTHLFRMTQIFEVLSLVSMPIVVEYSIAFSPYVLLFDLHLRLDECVLFQINYSHSRRNRGNFGRKRSEGITVISQIDAKNV